MQNKLNSFNLGKINFGAGDVPWLHSVSLGESAQSVSNPTVHLSPANGLPVASYKSFIALLNQQYSVTGMDCRGAWPERSAPPRRFGINDFADDLIRGIESKHSKPVIGMGHSHGGLVTVAASLKRPDLFSKLVIIDGASLPNYWSGLLLDLVPKELMIKFSALVRGSHLRKSVWKSPDAFYQRYRDHGTFKRFTEQDLRAYAEHGLFKRDDGQYELVFDPQWESHIFCHVRFLWSFLKRTTVPTLIIRAQHSKLYTEQQFKHNNSKLGEHMESLEIANTHHLLTHEKPELVASPILDWLGD